jgi:hypothetical protein
LFLDFLEQNGVRLSGLWGSVVIAWIDVAIDATVELNVTIPGLNNLRFHIPRLNGQNLAVTASPSMLSGY